jgi:hypothetical protein
MRPRTQSLADCRSYKGIETLRLLLSAFAALPAVAFLVVVHGTVLAARLQFGLSAAKETVQTAAIRIENKILV